MATVKQEEPIEKQLWKAADKLRKNIDAAEYKHVVMGLVFLKYISDSFEELYNALKAQVDMGADPEDRDEYKAENIFFVPPSARWSHLLSNAKLPNIGKIVDEAMDAIERENSSLKGVLPKVFARDNLDSKSLGGLIDLIGNIALGDAKARSAAELFEVQRPAVTKHLSNIFKSGELDEKVVCSILEHTTKHGAIEDKKQTKKVKFYNLDTIILDKIVVFNASQYSKTLHVDETTQEKLRQIAIYETQIAELKSKIKKETNFNDKVNMNIELKESKR